MISDAAGGDRLAFLGTAGSGKTYGAGTRVERLLHLRARCVIIDPLGVWWGLRLKADGSGPSPYNVVIIGGKHGDLPLHEHAGALIGETVAKAAESFIISLDDLGTKAAERRFMLAFLTALYRHVDGDPLHLVIDEADLFAPQMLRDKEGEAAKLLGQMETIVRRGRVKGFIPWLITQRPAVISKDVLSQVDGLVAFKLTASQDRDAIGDWVRGQADFGRWNAIRAELPTLPRGKGIVWIPGRDILDTVGFPEKVTFDSSATPKPGEKRDRAKLRPLNVDALKARMDVVVTEAHENDPRLLRERVRQLEVEARHLRDIDANLTAAEQRGYERGFAKGEERTREKLVAIRNAVNEALQWLEPYQTSKRISEPQARSAPEAPAVPDTRKPPPLRDISPVIVKPILPEPPQPVKEDPWLSGIQNRSRNDDLPKGERLCLIAIAQHPDGVTREQLSILSGYKKSSRDAYVSRLLARGCVALSSTGIVATDAGISVLGEDFERLPTGHALRQHWMIRLPEGEARILGAIVENYPRSLPRSAIDVGYKKSSRDAYLSRLRARQLITITGEGVRASDTLFG